MQITELAAKVQLLGLTDKEAKVYVAALFLGPAPVQKIAEQADINRATAYVILEQLCEMGLVAQSSEGKKTVFVAEGPETLKRLFDLQMEAVEAKRRELETMLPELKQAQRADTHKAPVVRFYKGSEGVQTLLGELQRKIRPGSEVYALANYDEIEKVVPDLFKTNPTKRVKKKVSSKVFYSYRKDVPSDPKLMRQTVKVGDPVLADVSLLEDWASFCTYAGKNSLGVLIESPEIVGALRQLFELAWQQQKPKN